MSISSRAIAASNTPRDPNDRDRLREEWRLAAHKTAAAKDNADRLRDGKKVLFTTFTVNLAHDVRRQIEKLLDDLARYCVFRVVGLTATPFRGNGVWLTSGDDPLFCGIAHEVEIKELLDADAPEHWYDEDEWRCK